jgi:hypothetical protein
MKHSMKNKRGEGFQGIIIGAILISLFAFLILTFATDTMNTYGKDTTELEEGAFSLTPYENYLTDVESQSQTFQDRFASGNIFSIIAGIVVTGIFNIGIDMITLITTPFTLFAQILNNVIGVPPIFTSVLLGITILTIIFAIWRLIKIGN